MESESPGKDARYRERSGIPAGELLAVCVRLATDSLPAILAMSTAVRPDPAVNRPRMPRAVWILGIVSLLTDVSSELAHALLPLLIVGSFGAGMFTLGLIEGIAESTAAFCKLFAGRLSDAIGRRKALIVVGYGLSTLSKPLFPLASSVGLVLGARVIDRIGKGIRGAPRDALLADVTPPALRGEAYGLRQSLDTIGAVLGPLAAIALMLWLGAVRSALWFAVLPAALGVLVLIVWVQEPATRSIKHASLWSTAAWRELPAAFWRVIAITALLGLARFGEAFLIVLGRDRGLGEAWAPLALVVMSSVYAASAWPAGWLADRLDRSGLLMIAIVALLGADLVLAFGHGPLWFALGVALWGLHLGFSQGVLAALVADAAPSTLRGTAFGVFHGVTGAALLAASLIAGGLWQWRGASACFLGGAVFAALGLLLLTFNQGRAAPAKSN